jgi:hypothetical protein
VRGGGVIVFTGIENRAPRLLKLAGMDILKVSIVVVRCWPEGAPLRNLSGEFISNTVTTVFSGARLPNRLFSHNRTSQAGAMKHQET